MARLVTTDAQLRRHLPNIIAAVKGETPFIQRIALFLSLAEEWVISTFTGEKVFGAVADGDAPELHDPLANLVVADALRRAIPALDIVLTPNGFAVVNTSNLAPASTQRVDRLVSSMLAHRDDCIAAILRALPSAHGWLETEQARYFAATLFPDLRVVDAVEVTAGSKWEKFLELHSRIVDVEGSLAEEWFSPELMAALRLENISGTLSANRRTIAELIKAQIVNFLRDGKLYSRRLVEIVNRIRIYDDDFQEWHRSDTALIFSPPVFRNKKNSAGYFF